MRLEGGCSHSTVNFLDINVFINDDGKSFYTSLYKKPSFCPQYVPSWSFNRPSTLKGVFTGEARRMLLCSARAQDYMHELAILIKNLNRRGLYCLAEHAPFDASKRMQFIVDLASRPDQSRPDRHGAKKLVCVFSDTILSRKLRLHAKCASLVKALCTSSDAPEFKLDPVVG